MKRALLASILGIAASTAMVASSFGQGQIVFNNYESTPYHPVQYSTQPGAVLPDGRSAGELVGGTFSVQLYYGIGTVADFSGLTESITIGINPATPGYFQGPVVQIPGYVSGPVTFAILAWDTGSGATWSQASVRNDSPLMWQEPSVSTVPSPAGFFTALPGPINVAVIPEPSTMALAGLGAAALMIFRRRK